MNFIPKPLVEPGPSSKAIGHALSKLIATIRNKQAMNTDTMTPAMNTPPPPPDDSYVVMLGRDVPKPCPRTALMFWHDTECTKPLTWQFSEYNHNGCLNDRHPSEFKQSDADAWYAVPKSALPDEKPAKPEPDAEGWIPHTPGDPCPCGADDKVEVKLRDGDEPGEWCAEKYNWSLTPSNGRQIIAWRPHKPAISTISAATSTISGSSSTITDGSSTISGPLTQQIGGDHYKGLAIQPAEFATRNKLSFLEGCVIKRVCRHRAKNGAEDIRKAMHELALILELEYGEKA